MKHVFLHGWARRPGCDLYKSLQGNLLELLVESGCRGGALVAAADFGPYSTLVECLTHGSIKTFVSDTFKILGVQQLYFHEFQVRLLCVHTQQRPLKPDIVMQWLPPACFFEEPVTKSLHWKAWKPMRDSVHEPWFIEQRNRQKDRLDFGMCKQQREMMLLYVHFPMHAIYPYSRSAHLRLHKI